MIVTIIIITITIINTITITFIINSPNYTLAYHKLRKPGKTRMAFSPPPQSKNDK